MDKNTLIGLLLIFALFMGFSFYNTSKNKKLREAQEKQIAEQLANQPQTDSLVVLPDDSLNALQNSDSSSIQVQNQPHEAEQKSTSSESNLFSSPELADESDLLIETNVAKYSISKRGGYVKRVELKNIYAYSHPDSTKKPLVLFDADDSEMNIKLMLHNQSIVNTKDLFFLSEQEDTLVVDGNEPNTLSLRLYPNQSHSDSSSNTCQTLDYNSYIEFLYTFKADDYRFSYDIKFVNMSKYLYGNSQDFTFEWLSDINTVEKNYSYEKNITTIYYMDNVKEVDNLSERDNDKKDFTTPLKWVSFKQQFFTSSIIADESDFSSGSLSITLPDKSEDQLLKSMSAELEFPIKNLDDGSFNMSFYYGPNQYKLLKQYDLELERQVPLGWGFFLLQWINRFAVIPVFNWLEAYGITYGIIILILTIILKTVLLPVAYKTYMSSARMRVLKPEIEMINAKYPNTQKQEDMAKKQQATMSLYRSAGVNPMSGCLPMLFQLPILYAMFRFFPSAYELRQKSFLWADDLSTYDSILDLSFNIPFYGDHVSLFTLLMTVATIVYTWLNNKLMAPTGAADQQKMMKVFMYVMPILFLGMFNSFSSALTYYYLLVNLITFFQMWIFRMAVDEKKLRAKINANMAKPVKKSKWQLKMEQMAKQQAQLQQQANNSKKR